MRLLLLFLITATTLTSCSSDDDCNCEYVQGEIQDYLDTCYTDSFDEGWEETVTPNSVPGFIFEGGCTP